MNAFMFVYLHIKKLIFCPMLKLSRELKKQIDLIPALKMKITIILISLDLFASIQKICKIDIYLNLFIS